jgi:hypothetical protein
MEAFMQRNNRSSSALRSVFYEKFDALLDECNQVIDNAEFGQTFHGLDGFFCTKGHTFLQEVFQEKLQKRIEHVQTIDEAKHCKLVDSLLEYFRNNSERLNYCERLASGRMIGSGLIEGACKNLIGRRFKQTKSCWRIERANKMAFTCSLLYAEQWKNAWKNTT